MLAWRTLGFPLAFSKGKRGKSLIWIGVQVHLQASAVQAEITSEKLEELAQLIKQALSSNVVALKAMRTFVGKAQNVAGIIHAWRPFLSNIWGAVSETNSEKRGNAPKGCLWLTQVKGDLEWIGEFLAGTKGTITRTFRLTDYLCRGDKVTLITDASPWGIGAWIVHQNGAIQYFSDKLQDHDLVVLEAERGDCRGQQAFEALAILVALRTWKQLWAQRRTSITVKADNVAALTLTATMKAKRGAMSRLAREMALDIAEGLYTPNLVAHIPGVVNDCADALSRRFQPGKTFQLPSLLAGGTEISVGNRDISFWRSLR